ncbi:hypothetical protein [Flavivirga rizhaonensis]|uniref:Uncharacterized protein n=1 Tax=Flavivirga rizhaonensis TaxID=2559571 RepID=A0A4S1E2U6_9FLAO|nr:hypothetical protein [Flavivirga rizhaonensis]TGV04308.1 hypothetical protein EM932_01965 [Flavivirga rizhaonensis]
MKKIILLFVISLMFSCGNEKVVLLPEINHANITEIHDVSPAYLFYDTTQKDSVELNRKNLISTTNWLVNVDKRLTLKQVIPHIKFLQDKKQNSSHKKKGVKNYFTCNDTSKKNLGFIEFTDVVYHNSTSVYSIEENDKLKSEANSVDLIVFDVNDINIITMDHGIFKTDTSSLLNIIKDSLNSNSKAYEIFLRFEKDLTFQDYISIKSILSEIKNEYIKISNHEGISN